MPQAIAAAVVAAVGITGTAAVIATAVLAVGISVGLSALAFAVFGPSVPKPSDGQQQTRVAVGSRTRHYGIVHTSGQLTFLESNHGNLGQVITLGTGEETEILEHRLSDKVVTLDGSGIVQGSSYKTAIRISTRLGSDTQAAIGGMFNYWFPQWTVDHRQRGCAHAAILSLAVEQKHFQEVFNGRMPEYSQVRKAAKVYDPRDGTQLLANKATWKWSDNAALVIADYVAHPDGYGLGYDNVKWENIADEADIADETVDTVTGQVIARWRLWASYSMVRDERRQVLTDLLKACDGFCFQDAECKFNLKVGRFEEPTVVITDDHILGMTATLGPDAQRRVSALKVLYTEADIGYREQESATVGGGGEGDPNTDAQRVEVYYAPHHNQAVRLGKLLFARLADDRWHISPQLNLFGLNLLGERFCRLESQQLGVSAYFAIERLRLNLAGKRVEATLSEVKPDDWYFDPDTDEGTPPVADGTVSDPVEIEVPTGLSLIAVQIALGETGGVAIKASWDAPSRLGLVWQARYRPSAGGDWVMMTVDDDARTGQSGVVDSGTEYEVQVRALTFNYWPSEWSASELITPAADALLSAPSDLGAAGAAGHADVTFRMPTEPSLAYARLYRNTTPTFGSAVQVGGNIVGGLGEVIAITDSGLSAGGYFYWARAFNASGGPSAVSGPVGATVT